MVFECHAERTLPTQNTVGIVCEASFKVKQARSKGDVWQSKVLRTRESLEDEDIVLVKLGAIVGKGMAIRKQK
jgi:hypothetical protein